MKNSPATAPAPCRGCLLILRGISGAGKSTFAAQLQARYGDPHVAVFEADQFRMHEGEYRFHPRASKWADAACFAAAVAAMIAGKPLVILSSANTRWRSFSRYLAPAEAQGYCVRQYVLLIDPDTGFARNVHRVPLDILRRQAHNLHNACLAEASRGVTLRPWDADEFERCMGLP